jgi:hypothetical protein
MFGGFSKFMALREKGRKAPSRTVTSDEFVEAAVAAGWDPAKAKMHLAISKVMGSGVLVGDEVLEVKDHPPVSGKAHQPRKTSTRKRPRTGRGA